MPNGPHNTNGSLSFGDSADYQCRSLAAERSGIKETARPADYVSAVQKSTGLQPLLFGSNLRILQGAARVPGGSAERITECKPARWAFFFIRKNTKATTARPPAGTRVRISSQFSSTLKLRAFHWTRYTLCMVSNACCVCGKLKPVIQKCAVIRPYRECCGKLCIRPSGICNH